MAKKWVNGEPDKGVEKKIYDKDGKVVDLEGKILVNGKLQEQDQENKDDKEDLLNLKVEDEKELKESAEEKEFYNKRRIEESIAEIQAYNSTGIYDFDPKINDIQIYGPKVLVRFRRLNKYDPDTKLYLGEVRRRKMDARNVEIKGEALHDVFQVTNEAVVAKVGDVTKDIQVNDVVFINKDNGFERSMRFLKQFGVNDQFDNYYLVDERQVDWLIERKGE